MVNRVTSWGVIISAEADWWCHPGEGCTCLTDDSRGRHVLFETAFVFNFKFSSQSVKKIFAKPDNRFGLMHFDLSALSAYTS